MLAVDKDCPYLEEYFSRETAEKSFYEFTKQAWTASSGPSSPYVDGWHIQAICEHLEALYNRQIRKLIINLPPRCGKSSIISVFLPAWVWIHRPDEEFFYASYAHSLALRDSLACRRLILSEWYQYRWGHLFQLRRDQNSKVKFDNDKNGYRSSTGLSGSLTGFGGSFNVLDDPNNVSEGESDAIRNSTNDTISAAWSTRVNNPKKAVQLIVQQRIHAKEVSGYIMENDVDKEWVRCIIPMEFEENRRAKTIILPSTNGKVWQDPRKKEGELLWPAMYGEKELRSLKNMLGSEYRIAGQLQQRPSPQEGSILKREWFCWWKMEKPPQLLQTIQSWDTALESNDKSAYSACTTWGLFNDQNMIPNLILLSLWRGKLEYPELRSLAKRLYADYRDDGEQVDFRPDGKHVPDIVLVEAKVSGISLFQDFRRAGIPAFKWDPGHDDKIQRVRVVSSYIECGRVWVPAKPPDYTKLRKFSDVLVENCCLFPNDESRDIVDTMTQVLQRLVRGGWLKHARDDNEYEAPVNTGVTYF